ncbi:hypothetical protein QZM19_02830 [Burkholderia multivorans]|uniref:hypothetical protein n=1 Tax=Burkholderia multivorans TaxID=87883 RepID=UPI0011B1CE3E|nr:hypothetical protein [Burkholderia multivorans]MDN7862317.1 hypothetical protein [Burkholderia multivorans]
MTMNLIPESGALADLSAKVDTLEIALLTALSLQAKPQAEAFLKAFEQNVQARESINRNTEDPLTWKERLSPHAKRLIQAMKRR